MINEKIIERSNLLNFEVFNLKKIKDNLSLVNEFFNTNFDLLKKTNTNTELIDSSFLLLKEIQSKTKELTELYLADTTNNSIVLNEFNLLITDNPIYCKQLTFNIKNFYLDNYYEFKLTINYLNEKNEYCTKERFVFPAFFAGNYKEEVKFINGIYKSKFQLPHESKPVFKSKHDNSIVELKFDYTEDNYLLVSKENCFEEVYVEYKLNSLSNTIELNGSIVKLFINTNYKGKNLKYFNLLSGDDINEL